MDSVETAESFLNTIKSRCNFDDRPGFCKRKPGRFCVQKTRKNLLILMNCCRFVDKINKEAYNKCVEAKIETV